MLRWVILAGLAIVMVTLVAVGVGLAASTTRAPSELRLALTSDGHDEVAWATREPLSNIFASEDTVTLDNTTTLHGMHRTTFLHSDHFPWLVALTTHRADLGLLAPASTHTYQVPRASPVSFRVASEDELSIVVLGDTGLNEHDRAFVKQAADLQPDIILHVGDLAYAFNDEGKWEAWMAALQEASKRTPFQAVPGNHERDFGERYRNYDARFDASGTHHASHELGPVHFVQLDSEDLDTAQDAWLANDLAHVDRARTPWLIVLLHRPLYSSGVLHTSEAPAREHFERLFDDARVDLVLSGHEHNYERTYPVVAGARNATGPVYVVTGGGGATLYPDLVARHDWSAVRAATHEMLALHVTRAQLRATALREDGSALDSFTLTAP